MPFPVHVNRVAGGRPRLSRCQQGHEAPARHFGRRLDTRDLQERRCDIGVADQLADPAPARLPAVDVIAPPNDQRHAGTVVVERGLRPGEGHAVVRGEDNHCVVLQFPQVQHLNHAAHMVIDVLDFGVVLVDVLPHRGHVGQERRDGRRRRVLAARRGHAGRISPVRFVRAHPEHERSIRLRRIQKRLEVGGVVDIRHGQRFESIAERLDPNLVVRLSCRVHFPVDEKSGRPALAGGADAVAVLCQQLRIRREFGRQVSPQRGPFLQLEAVPAGKDGRPGRRAGGRADEGVLEGHALPGQPVEVGRIHLIAAVGAHVRPAHVVGDDEDDIRRCAAGFLAESNDRNIGGQKGCGKREAPRHSRAIPDDTRPDDGISAHRLKPLVALVARPVKVRILPRLLTVAATV